MEVEISTETVLSSTNSSFDAERRLLELDIERRTSLVPLVIYVALLVIIGVFGNLTVCYYYGYKAGRSSYNVFIIALSVLDLMACCLSMPAEAYGMLRPYTYNNRVLCKISKVFVYIFPLVSWIIIVNIAIFRYRSVCKPYTTNKDKDLRLSKNIIMASVIFSFALCSPISLGYDVDDVKIPTGNGTFAVGRICMSGAMKRDSYLMFLIVGVSLLFSITGTCILIALYTKIFLKLYKHFKRMNQNFSLYRMTPFASNTNLDAFSVRESSDTEDSYDRRIYRVPSISSYLDGLSSRSSRSMRKTIRSMKLGTLQMFVIAFLFVLSIWPSQIVLVWRTMSRVPRYQLPPAMYVGLDSQFFGYSLNPFVYGIFSAGFNSKFLLCKCCLKPNP